jgi:chloramphenicol-sensitive protein RarD
MSRDVPPPDPRDGILYGLAAYGFWGFAAFYFRAVGHVSPFEILAHRIVWSVVLVAGLLAWSRRFGELKSAVREPGSVRTLLLSGALVAVNWLCFVYAIDTDRLLHASLGYFINPLVSIVLGMVFLGERLRVWQWLAVGLAVAGVGAQTVVVGELPWIAIVVAVTFGLYGLVRKRSHAGPIIGLAVETTLLLPISIAFLVAVELGLIDLGREHAGTAFLNTDARTAGLLILAGAMTTLPLLWFTAAARRLPLTTIGFLQYIAPTIHFLIAVLAFGEVFGLGQGVAFALIWTGVAVFVADSFARRRTENRARRARIEELAAVEPA